MHRHVVALLLRRARSTVAAVPPPEARLAAVLQTWRAPRHARIGQLDVPAHVPAHWTAPPAAISPDIGLRAALRQTLPAPFPAAWAQVAELIEGERYRLVMPAVERLRARNDAPGVPRVFFQAGLLAAMRLGDEKLMRRIWTMYRHAHARATTLDYVMRYEALDRLRPFGRDKLELLQEMVRDGVPRHELIYNSIFARPAHLHPNDETADFLAFIDIFFKDETVRPTAAQLSHIVNRLFVKAKVPGVERIVLLVLNYLPHLRAHAAADGADPLLATRIDVLEMETIGLTSGTPGWSAESSMQLARGLFFQILDDIAAQRQQLEGSPAPTRDMQLDLLKRVQDHAICSYARSAGGTVALSVLRDIVPLLGDRPAMDVLAAAMQLVRRQLTYAGTASLYHANVSASAEEPLLLWQAVVDCALRTEEPLPLKLYNHMAHSLLSVFRAPQHLRARDPNAQAVEQQQAYPLGQRTAYDAVRALMEHMRSRGVTPDWRTFLVLLDTLAFWQPPPGSPPQAGTDEVVRVMQEMAAQRIVISNSMRIKMLLASIYRVPDDDGDQGSIGIGAASGDENEDEDEARGEGVTSLEAVSRELERAEDIASYALREFEDVLGHGNAAATAAVDEDGGTEQPAAPRPARAIAVAPAKLAHRFVLDPRMERQLRAFLVNMGPDYASPHECNAFIRALGRIGRVDEMAAVWKDAMQRLPDAADLSVATYVYLKAAAFAVKVLQPPLEPGVVPTCDTVSPTDSSAQLAHKTLLHFAQVTHAYARSKGADAPALLASAYLPLLSLCADSGDRRLADAVLWAKENRFPVHQALLRMLAPASLQADQQPICVEIAMEPAQPLPEYLSARILHEYIRACDVGRIERLGSQLEPSAVIDVATLRLLRQRCATLGLHEQQERVHKLIQRARNDAFAAVGPGAVQVHTLCAHKDFEGAVRTFQRMAFMPCNIALTDPLIGRVGHRLVSALAKEIRRRDADARPDAAHSALITMLNMKFPEQRAQPWLGRLTKLAQHIGPLNVPSTASSSDATA